MKFAVKIAVTFFCVTQTARAAGGASDTDLGADALTPFGYLLVIGFSVSIIGLAVWLFIKKRRKLD